MEEDDLTSDNKENENKIEEIQEEEEEEENEEASKRFKSEVEEHGDITMEDYALEEEQRKLKKEDGSGMAKAAKIKILNEGDVNRVPLAISQEGNRVWARRRDPPFQLQYTDIRSSSEQIIWVDTGTPLTAGMQGSTRCSAALGYFVMQRHADGVCVFTDGNSHTTKFYLHWDRDEHIILATTLEDAAEMGRCPTDYAVCTAMACVGRGLGFAAVVEDYGLIYVNMTKFVYEPMAVVNLDTSAGDNIISSLGVCANLVAYCIGNDEHEYSRNLIVCNVLEPLSKAHIKIPNMNPVMHNDDDEKIWQVALGPDCAAIVTTERCLWISIEKKRWRSSTTTGIVASAINPHTQNLVFLTVLGDCFFLHMNGEKIPQRLEENSGVQPFATAHTRDGMIAWGTDGGPMNECVRMIKAGAEIHQVDPEIQGNLKQPAFF